MWVSQITSFSSSHRVVVPDLRGHGDSTVTEGKVTMLQMANDVAGLLDELGVERPITLCGLSMGGYVAWEFWRNHHSKLARLILCDTLAMADTAEIARGRQMMAAQVGQAGAKMAADSMVPRLLGAKTHNNHPSKVEAVREMILATDPVGIAATQRGMAERRDMTSLLSEINIPTLVLCGEDDMISPSIEMRAIVNAMPNARYVEITDAGHLAPLEQPAAANDAIRALLADS